MLRCTSSFNSSLLILVPPTNLTNLRSGGPVYRVPRPPFRLLSCLVFSSLPWPGGRRTPSKTCESLYPARFVSAGQGLGFVALTFGHASAALALSGAPSRPKRFLTPQRPLTP